MNLKCVKINNENTTFYISDTGKLFNQKTNNWLKGSVKGGYLIYELRWKNKKYPKLAHKLVAESFLENPENKPVVNHKDGNKLNNIVQNLEWNTVSENNIHAYETGLKEKTNGTKIQYNFDLKEEIWKPYKDTVYLISNKGRARNAKTNNLLKGKVTKDGYVEWCMILNNKKRSLLAHRIVYDVFSSEGLLEGLIINHKDGNKTNNQMENLEQISNSDNIVHSYYTIQTNTKIKKVGKYTLQNELIEIYPSCAEAARQNLGCYPNLICNVCNGKKKTHKGYIWKYE